MLFDDLVHVRLVDIGIPGPLGVDDQHGTFFAAIHASGLVDAHLVFARETQLLDAAFCVVAHPLRAVIVAARLAIVALVAAEKDVIAVVAHGQYGQWQPAYYRPRSPVALGRRSNDRAGTRPARLKPM